MKTVVLVLCGLLLATLTTAPVEAAYQVGDPVADFTLYDAYGTPVSLYDYQNTVIFLTFWTDT